MVKHGTYSRLGLGAAIYSIKNTVTGKRYIGKTKTINTRISKHFTLLNRNSHPNSELQSEFNAFGINSFKVRVITNSKVTSEREISIIRMLNRSTLYNTLISSSDFAKQRTGKGFKRTAKYKQTLSKAKHLFNVYKLSKSMDVIKIYDSYKEAIADNTDYKQSPLLGACNGSKKSYKGFIWRYWYKNSPETFDKTTQLTRNTMKI